MEFKSGCFVKNGRFFCIFILCIYFFLENFVENDKLKGL